MRETATPLLGRNAQPHVCAHYHVTSSATARVAVCELATRRAVRAPPSAPRAPPPARRASYAEKPCTFQLDDVAEKKEKLIGAHRGGRDASVAGRTGQRCRGDRTVTIAPRAHLYLRPTGGVTGRFLR